MKRISLARCALILGVALTMGIWLPVAVAAESSAAGTIEGRIKSALTEAGDIELERLPDSTPFDLHVADGEQVRVRKLAIDTVIRVEVDDRLNPTKLTRLNEASVAVGAYQRVIAIGVAFLTLLLLATVATRGNPLRFLLGLDNRYSNSQCQIVFWFGLLAVIYVSTVALRIIYLGSNFIGGVGLTANVIALTGLSALSFGGAKIITTQKTSLNARVTGLSSMVGRMHARKDPAPHPNVLTDLFQNDHGDADFGDFQMILVTLAAVGIYLSSSFVFLGHLWPDATVVLPDLDSALLSAFGLGQGAYLVKKAAMKPGEG